MSTVACETRDDVVLTEKLITSLGKSILSKYGIKYDGVPEKIEPDRNTLRYSTQYVFNTKQRLEVQGSKVTLVVSYNYRNNTFVIEFRYDTEVAAIEKWYNSKLTLISLSRFVTTFTEYCGDNVRVGKECKDGK